MSTFTSQNKSSTTWSAENISSGTISYLLKEDDGYLLLESGDKIILEQSSGGVISWTSQNKS